MIVDANAKFIEMRTREPGLNVYDTPSYRAREVAYLLAVPDSTVRAWCFGQASKGRSGATTTRFASVIRPADPRNRLLSFSNLCEIHILGAITRKHRVPLQRVRKAFTYVREKLNSDRPLLDKEFQTNGLDLFLEHSGQLVNVSQSGQTALRGEFEQALARIERDQQGLPIRLFPFTRLPGRSSEQPIVVAIDPHIAFGRPVIARARVATDVIADRFGAGDSPAEMAKDYGVGEEEILEALRYEQRLAAA